MPTETITTTTSDQTGDARGYWFNDAVYDWLGSLGAGAECKSWIPFTTVSLPKGARIISATLKMYAEASSAATTVKVKVGCEAADNPSAPTTWATLDARTLTTAYSAITLPAWTAGTQYSLDVTSAVQEIVNRAGWAAGNKIAILIQDNAGTDTHKGSSFDSATYGDPTLEIVYTTFIPQIIIF